MSCQPRNRSICAYRLSLRRRSQSRRPPNQRSEAAKQGFSLVDYATMKNRPPCGLCVHGCALWSSSPMIVYARRDALRHTLGVVWPACLGADRRDAVTRHQHNDVTVSRPAHNLTRNALHGRT